MTMGDEALFASMTVPVILAPILEKLEQRHIGSAQTLRSAITKVEQHHPGFCYDLVKGLLRKADLQGSIDMTEAFLRLEAINSSREFYIMRSEPDFEILNERAALLKRILSRIPSEINNRQTFLETIKDIANAIRNLLDAVNNIFAYIDAASKPAVDQRKRDFVKYSKKFSNTLKEFFKDNRKSDVFYSANHLINQTNLIMKAVKDVC